MMDAASYVGDVGKIAPYVFHFQSEDAPLLESMALRASRVFDRAANVEDGHFRKADEEASDRILYGIGVDRLLLPPHLAESVTAVELPEGYAEVGSEFIEQGDYLVRTVGGGVLPAGAGFDCLRYLNNPLLAERLDLEAYFRPFSAVNAFPYGVPVTVTAKWGGRFESVPADVEEAVLELVVAMHRGKDTAFARLIDVDTNRQILDALPARTKMVAESYRGKRPLVFA